MNVILDWTGEKRINNMESNKARGNLIFQLLISVALLLVGYVSKSNDYTIGGLDGATIIKVGLISLAITAVIAAFYFYGLWSKKK